MEILTQFLQYKIASGEWIITSVTHIPFSAQCECQVNIDIVLIRVT